MNIFKILPFIVLGILFSEKANAQKTALAENEIPLEITNYINQNFKDHKTRKVIKEISNNKVVYKIKLNRNVELEFGEAYTIREIESKLGVSMFLLPVRIVEYVQTNYPNFKVIEWELDEEGQKVELYNDIEILFDSNGNFVK
ncbi:PepSY-like domain-containing protein [Algoriphagus aquimarinus]|uniref:Putative beta-lactamase-inhibitor-like, PepSY-like n=1 Tax=Algoriphagus aquimarinus TaxID=237018 RepID=A0A1I1BIB3_9BACT|nr:PepSY-like domain-containing protein [Algoriphagus aquimarinus]SFB50105.1 Putative beta-lactamase-inhibitor-like, PepSY-like [Algoriphagus aquimarinus]